MNAVRQILLMLLQLCMDAAVLFIATLLTVNAELAQVLQVKLGFVLPVCCSTPQQSIFCC